MRRALPRESRAARVRALGTPCSTGKGPRVATARQCSFFLRGGPLLIPQRDLRMRGVDCGARQEHLLLRQHEPITPSSHRFDAIGDGQVVAEFCAQTANVPLEHVVVGRKVHAP